MKFSKTHEWIDLEEGKEIAVVGISKKALSELGEIVFIQLPKPGQELSEEEPMAVVESTKAAIDIYAPLPGVVVEVNEALTSDVSLLNEDPEGKGWICKVQVSQPFSDEHLMSPACYAQL